MKINQQTLMSLSENKEIDTFAENDASQSSNILTINWHRLFLLFASDFWMLIKSIQSNS